MASLVWFVSTVSILTAPRVKAAWKFFLGFTLALAQVPPRVRVLLLEIISPLLLVVWFLSTPAMALDPPRARSVLLLLLCQLLLVLLVHRPLLLLPQLLLVHLAHHHLRLLVGQWCRSGATHGRW
jgi:hypothetical protein